MSTNPLHALVAAVQLVDIRTASIEGTVDLRAGVKETGTDEVSTPVEIKSAVAVSDDANRLLASLSATIDRLATPSSPAVHMHVEIAALYELTGWRSEELDENLLSGFTYKAAAYQMLPFLREAFFGLAARLRVQAPILPLMPQDLGPAEFTED